MRHIYINEAETIFEEFWDSGDSYSNNEKYNRMKNYQESGDGEYKIAWNGVQVNTTGSYKVSRELELDISSFDRLTLCMSLPEGMTVKLRAEIDGKLREIVTGEGDLREFEGEISGEKLTRIEIELIKTGVLSSPGTLYWLGLANSVKREEMLAKDNGYGEDCWEGCLNEDFEIKPHLSAFFDETELDIIREKIKTEEFGKIFDELNKRAEKYLNCNPEKYISEYIGINNKRFGRSRDFDKPALPYGAMVPLAFVGLVKKDKAMIKMACRIALSVACCKNWCEGIIGVFPGVTWHHRSFLEGSLCTASAKVLDWAGEAMTWHGRNIVYDAIIIKGIPRIEADIHTMDYVWHMNQGIVFTSELITTLIVLSKRYPRYSDSIDKYETAICQMWGNYVNDDGGSGEGPGYWNYSAEYFMWTIYQIAKSKGKKLAEYMPDSLKKAELYAKGSLSTAGDGIYHIPINDTHIEKGFDLMILAFFASAGQDKKYWSSVFKKSVKDTSKLVLLDELMIVAKDIEFESIEESTEDEYIPVVASGVVVITRESGNVGKTALFVNGGVAEAGGHEHEDKGSFILESDRKAILIDRGVCDYSSSNTPAFITAKWHNVLYPEIGKEVHQVRCNNEKCAKILKHEYSDGVFVCTVDVAPSWDGIFKKNVRTVISPAPELYIIHDSIECDCDVSFRANTYGHMNGNVIENDNIKLYVHTMNWMPEKITCEDDGTDGNGTAVNQLRLFGRGTDLITVFELSNGESKALVDNNTIKYKNITVKFDGEAVVINDRKII